MKTVEELKKITDNAKARVQQQKDFLYDKLLNKKIKYLEKSIKRAAKKGHNKVIIYFKENQRLNLLKSRFTNYISYDDIGDLKISGVARLSYGLTKYFQDLGFEIIKEPEGLTILWGGK